MSEIPDWAKDPHFYRSFERVEADGEVVTYRLYTIGALSQALGKSQVGLRRWMRYGIIPEPSLRTSPVVGNRGDAGLRLWTSLQIQTLVVIAKQEGVWGSVRRDTSSFAARVKYVWDRQGW